MPLYSYRCKVHGEMERLTSYDERGNQHCHCGLRLERLFTVPSVIVVKTGRDTVLDTLNKEHRGTPTRDTMLIAEGLKTPEHTFGRGWSRKI